MIFATLFNKFAVQIGEMVIRNCFPVTCGIDAHAGSTSAVNSMTKLKKIKKNVKLMTIAPKTNHYRSITWHTKIIIPAMTAVMQWKTRRCCQQIAELLDMSRNDRTTEVSQHSSLTASSQNHCIIIIISTIIILKLEETRPACSTKLQSMGHKQNLCAQQTLLQVHTLNM